MHEPLRGISILANLPADVFPGFDQVEVRKLAIVLPSITTVLLDNDGVLLDDSHLLEIAVSALARLQVILPQEKVIVDGKLRAPHSKIELNVLHLAIQAGRSVTLEQVNLALAESTAEIKQRHGGAIPEQLCLNANTLPQLKQRYLLGLVTSRRRESINRILPALGLENLFAAEVTLDDVSAPKPDPQGLLKALYTIRQKHPERECTASNCIYIGDMHTDMRAARAAGMYGIGVIAPMDRGAADIAAHELYKAGAVLVLQSTDRFLDIRETLLKLTLH